ncbi:MAG: PIN domain-containing protein [Treponema sp.]|nr:PIN domain-containing protein [Treponema sp.]
MTLLIDTNIILDYLDKRTTYTPAIDLIFNKIFSNQISGLLAAHSITNLWYILRKQYSDSKRRELISALLEYFEITAVDKAKLLSAINRSDFKDFEDCLQDECAIAARADCIVTRNKKDFERSQTPVFTPEEFVTNFSA